MPGDYDCGRRRTITTRHTTFGTAPATSREPLISCQPVDAFLNDLRYALRQLRKAPLFSSVAILTLAIGIGATTAIFSTVNATLLRPLPFPDADQLVDVHTRLDRRPGHHGMLSSVEIGALHDSRSVVTGVAGLTNQPFEATFMRERWHAGRRPVERRDRGFFDVSGSRRRSADAFTHEEHLVGRPRRAVRGGRLRPRLEPPVRIAIPHSSARRSASPSCRPP